jgi:predicted type IV restriction endonuclease
MLLACLIEPKNKPDGMLDKETVMEKELLDAISNIKSNKDKMLEYDETKTKNALILKILSLLDWDAFNVDEVCPEYSIGSGRVDYSLRIGNVNKVFVEVKKTGEELEKGSYQEQLLRYSFDQGIKLAVLTNGFVWWFYLPLTEGTWEQRKFYSINLLQQDINDVVGRFIDFLSKDNINNGNAYQNAESVYKSQQKLNILQETIPKAWNKIISEPNELLIEIINEITEGICGYKAEDEVIIGFLDTYKERFTVGSDVIIKPKRSTKSSKTIDLSNKNILPISGSFSKKKISAFHFLGLRYKVDNWKSLLLTLCGIMSERHEKEFDRVIQLKSTKHPYFTYNEDQLRKQKRINDTNIFVETNLNANSVVRLCVKLINLFGYSEDDIKIELADEKS